MQQTQVKPVTQEQMQAVFEESKTPHKFGVILHPEEGKMLNCPSVFRHGDAWWMAYVCMNKVGYETHLARSDDLLNWEPRGRILTFGDGGRHHPVGHAHSAAEVLVAADGIGGTRQERLTVERSGSCSGAEDVAAAAGLGRDRAPLLAGECAGEYGAALALPVGLGRVGARQPERDHRGMHRRHQRDRRVASSERAIGLTEWPGRRCQAIPEPTRFHRDGHGEEAGVTQCSELGTLEVAPGLAFGALRPPSVRDLTNLLRDRSCTG